MASLSAASEASEDGQSEVCSTPVSRNSTKRSLVTDAPVYHSSAQMVLGEAMRKPAYEIVLGIIVALNVVLIALDVDYSVGCPEGMSCKPEYLETLDYFLLGVYTLDIMAGLFVKRIDFFRDAWNYLDLTIVGFGYLELVLMQFMSGRGGLSMVRMLRMARILRIARLLKPLPMLYKLITGFVGTLRAIWYGFVMIVILLFVWAIIILQIYVMLEPDGLFGDDQQWCKEAMTSTLKVGLLLWQTMISGDSWGACAIPIILKHPVAWLIFASSYVMINLGFTNLILAVIVENATTQHEEEHLKQLEEQKKRHEREIANFTNTFQELDENDDNEISLKEILQGFDAVPKFRSTLMKLGITRDDLKSMFEFLDEDDSGGISYTEFVYAMFRSQRQEAGTQLMMLRLAVSKMSARMEGLDQKLSEVLSVSNFRDIPANMPAADSGSVAHKLDGTPTILETSELALDESRLQSAMFEALEQRIQASSSAMQQQSLALAEETQVLSAALVQLGSKIKAAPSFPEWRGEQSIRRPSNDPVLVPEANLQGKDFALDEAREGETVQLTAKELTDGTISNGRELPASSMQPCWHSHFTPREPHKRL